MITDSIRDVEHAKAALDIAGRLVECLDDESAFADLNASEVAWAVSNFLAAFAGLEAVRGGCPPNNRIVIASALIDSITEIARLTIVGALLNGPNHEPG
jgi:hypothetical protein